MANSSRHKPIQIGADYHAALERLSERKFKETGFVHTFRRLVEDALNAHYPELLKSVQSAEKARAEAEDADRVIFEQLMKVAILEPDPAEQNRLIEGLAGSVKGSYGQAIKLKDLAYYLRGTDKGPITLRELVEYYEGIKKRARKH